MPVILDPHRPRLEGELDADTRLEQARDLDKALEQAADYGQYLWRQLRGVRQHLLDMLPVPGADDTATRTLTSPRGPGDDEGWERWQLAYEMVTSTLAGPHGDEGFARREAAMAAIDRRGSREYSARTAELVDIANARVGRAAEQLPTSHARAGAAPVSNRAVPTPTPGHTTRARQVPVAFAALAFVAGVVGGKLLSGRRRPV